jgi:aryl carrier-like protein
MVPKDVIVLERMRLTSNGKVDRKALPLPTREVYEDDESYAQQLSPVGKILTRIWRELLNLGRVDVNDNFFSLGGDSILAVQIAFEAKQMGLTLHPLQLFRHPTIAELESEISAPSQDFFEQDQTDAAVVLPQESAQSSLLDFPLANLNQEKVDRILRKLSK